MNHTELWCGVIAQCCVLLSLDVVWIPFSIFKVPLSIILLILKTGPYMIHKPVNHTEMLCGVIAQCCVLSLDVVWIPFSIFKVPLSIILVILKTDP